MRFVWISLGVAVLLLVAGSWWVIGNVNRAVGRGHEAVVVTVKNGAGVRDIAAALWREHLIPSAQAWNIYVVLTGARSNILAGSFTLNDTMTGRQILHALTATPDDARQVKVKILEGSTNKVIAAQLEKAGVISAADFLAAAGATGAQRSVTSTNYDFLASQPVSVDLEGFLFPDTYYFFKHSTAAMVLKKFLDNFAVKYTAEMRQATIARHRTIFQEVTMASILEAELKSDTDRALAADIFWRRFDAGMTLNADTTVHYALGSNAPLSLSDLKIESPYNTYIHAGLPAGPIGNPGLSALRAAISPKANAAWFYLTAPSGQTIFAKTLEEHNRNKALYLK